MAIMSVYAPDGRPRRHAWDPTIAKERSQVLKMVATVTALATIVIFTVQALYFGAYFRQEENAYRLTVRIIDMDSQYASTVAGAPTAILGPAVVQAAQQDAAASPGYHLGWQYASADDLQMFRVTQDGQGQNASEYARQIVLNQDVFGVILISSNATVLATEAALTGNTAYDPRGAIAIYYEEARNFYAANQYVTFHSTRVIEAAIAQASAQLASILLGSGGGTAALTTAANGNALSYPFYFSQFNLVPFDQLGAEPALTAGQIYLIIFTFFSSPIWKKAFEPLRRKLTMSSMLFLNWIVPVILYFWVSLMYSFVTLAFRVDMTRMYGRGGFPLYWALNWLSMTALGFIMETMLRIAGPLFFPFFLIFWVIWNVSVAFLDLSAQDPFYLYGFTTPVWNAIDAGKSILLGTKNHLTQDFVVNLSWVVVGSVLLLTTCWYQRSQEDKKELQEKKQEFKGEKAQQ